VKVPTCFAAGSPWPFKYKEKSLESITITTRDLKKLALIAESLIIELLFNASFKDPYFYDYVSKSVQNESELSQPFYFSSMRKGSKTKMTKYERTHHPSNLLISIAIHSKWIMDERFINLILQQLTPL
jgi:hypothetical protein